MFRIARENNSNQHLHVVDNRVRHQVFSWYWLMSIQLVLADELVYKGAPHEIRIIRRVELVN